MICARELCTGCAACANACPRKCIRMIPDSEGFLYPEMDAACCDNCGACRQVCPILHVSDSKVPASPAVYACWHRDDVVRYESASGGVFSALACHVLDQEGVVVGAAFGEDMSVSHVAIESDKGLAKLRGSKYVQSNVGRMYAEVKDLLQQGRTVLFSGTPCQVAALNAVVGRHREHLFTCDVLCHGVPSPELFSRYVTYLERKLHTKIVSVNFRHKRKGWHLPSTVAISESGREYVLRDLGDSFMYGFVNSITVRASCYRCPFTRLDREGDLTLGDFWGIGERAEFRQSTRHGVSLVLVNTDAGRALFENAKGRLHLEERSLDEATHERTKLSHPLPEPSIRKPFFEDYQVLGYGPLARKYLVDQALERLIKRIVPRTWIFHARRAAKRLRRGRMAW